MGENILINKKTGSILHIDFGFFLSNAPGGKVQLEKPIPFKLLTEYVEVLNGQRSMSFRYFRKLLFKGFKAIRKHKDKILILVKMMYSTQGQTLPCFKQGIKGIQALEERIAPPRIENDKQLYDHTNNLINTSLDNWRARWYDKYQYWAQGIFY